MDSRILALRVCHWCKVSILRVFCTRLTEVIYDYPPAWNTASNERSRYHTAFSLDSEDYEGTNLVSV